MAVNWTTPTYNAANFTGGGSMVWTVSSGSVVTYLYKMLDARTMLLAFSITATQTSGTMSTSLKVAIPEGFLAMKVVRAALHYLDAGTRGTGYLSLSTGAAVVDLRKIDDSAWSSSTGTSVHGQIEFEVTT